jgi:hypothetical protein
MIAKEEHSSLLQDGSFIIAGILILLKLCEREGTFWGYSLKFAHKFCDRLKKMLAEAKRPSLFCCRVDDEEKTF